MPSYSLNRPVSTLCFILAVSPQQWADLEPNRAMARVYGFDSSHAPCSTFSVQPPIVGERNTELTLNYTAVHITSYWASICMPYYLAAKYVIHGLHRWYKWGFHVKLIRTVVIYFNNIALVFHTHDSHGDKYFLVLLGAIFNHRLMLMW